MSPRPPTGLASYFTSAEYSVLPFRSGIHFLFLSFFRGPFEPLCSMFLFLFFHHYISNIRLPFPFGILGFPPKLMFPLEHRASSHHRLNLFGRQHCHKTAHLRRNYAFWRSSLVALKSFCSIPALIVLYRPMLLRIPSINRHPLEGRPSLLPSRTTSGFTMVPIQVFTYPFGTCSEGQKQQIEINLLSQRRMGA